MWRARVLRDPLSGSVSTLAYGRVIRKSWGVLHSNGVAEYLYDIGSFFLKHYSIS